MQTQRTGRERNTSRTSVGSHPALRIGQDMVAEREVRPLDARAALLRAFPNAGLHLAGRHRTFHRPSALVSVSLYTDNR